MQSSLCRGGVYSNTKPIPLLGEHEDGFDPTCNSADYIYFAHKLATEVGLTYQHYLRLCSAIPFIFTSQKRPICRSI